MKAALRRRYANPVTPDATAIPHLNTELGWRLSNTAPSTSAFLSTIGGSPFSTEQNLGLCANVPFASSLSLTPVPSQATLGWLASTQPATHVAGPLSPETGLAGLAPTTLNRSLMHQVLSPSFLTEVKANFTWGGQPLTLGLGASLGTSAVECSPLTSISGFKNAATTDFRFNNADILTDWRTLKLERELWRSTDFLGQGLQTF